MCNRQDLRRGELKMAVKNKPSLAFRNSVDKIYQGRVPKKYTRLVPCIQGNTVLEVGAAEGVLSLLLAQGKGRVIGIERNMARFQEALKLQQAWKNQGKKVDNCYFHNVDIANNLDLLDGIDTFAAFRTIYYFKENMDKIFSEISKKCRFLVLGGNKNRAIEYKKGTYLGNVAENNYFASIAGMKEIATRYGYTVETEISENSGEDPLVVGKKMVPKASTLPEYRLRDALLPYLKKNGLASKFTDIKIVHRKQIELPTDEVLRKSRNVIDECHIKFMGLYKQYGRKFDYRNTVYWKRFVDNGIEESKIEEKVLGFFDLYDSIKSKGFLMHKKNPVIVADLKGIMSDDFVEKKWRYHRSNGTHRLAIAKVLGIEKIPVLQLVIALKSR
jgi:hypothetical protein